VFTIPVARAPNTATPTLPKGVDLALRCHPKSRSIAPGPVWVHFIERHVALKQADSLTACTRLCQPLHRSSY